MGCENKVTVPYMYAHAHTPYYRVYIVYRLCEVIVTSHMYTHHTLSIYIIE